MINEAPNCAPSQRELTASEVTPQSSQIGISLLHLCPEMHAMAKMAKLVKNRQLLAIWIGCQKWPLGGWRFWRNWRFWQKSPCMQWRNWRKITSLWRFELDAKSGPLEAGDFGEIGDFGKNRQRAGDMWQNIQTGCQKWILESRELMRSI